MLLCISVFPVSRGMASLGRSPVSVGVQSCKRPLYLQAIPLCLSSSSLEMKIISWSERQWGPKRCEVYGGGPVLCIALPAASPRWFASSSCRSSAAPVLKWAAVEFELSNVGWEVGTRDLEVNALMLLICFCSSEGCHIVCMRLPRVLWRTGSLSSNDNTN